MVNKVTVHTDGGSRGNPGPAACAFTVDINGKEVSRGTKFLGTTTNNQAEYAGVLLALDWLNKNLDQIRGSEINFILDSELIVKQINGIYRVKDLGIKKVFDEVVDKLKSLNTEVSFRHVKRELNKTSDYLVNQELDKRT
jgi:ribonuclease HI